MPKQIKNRKYSDLPKYPKIYDKQTVELKNSFNGFLSKMSKDVLKKMKDYVQ